MSETDALPSPADRDASAGGESGGGESREAPDATQALRPQAADSPTVTHVGGAAEATEDGRGASRASARGGAANSKAGDSVGPYRLVRKLGEGGMGAVWEAVHVHLDRRVAVKLLPAQLIESPEAVARFHREMKAAGRVTHPNVVQAHDAGEVGGIPYLAMELVVGSDLHRLVARKGPLTPLNAARALRQAALGLAAAHGEGLVHRDVKPMNLLIGKDGKVKLLDLGLARLAGDAAEEASRDGLTRAGDVMGTPDYMAPEQWEDTHSAGPAVDLYALGCTLHFLLTGHPPFPGKSYASAPRKMAAHVSQAPPDLAAARPDVPPGLCELYRRLMAKNPDDRPRSAMELAEALLPFTIRPSDSSNVESSRVDLTSGAATVALAPGSAAVRSATAPTAAYLPAVKTLHPSKPPTATVRKASAKLPVVWLGAAGIASLLLICGMVAVGAYALGDGGAAGSEVEEVARVEPKRDADVVANPGGEVQLAVAPDTQSNPTGEPAANDTPFDAALHREVAVRAFQTGAAWVEIDGSQLRLSEVGQLPTRPFRLTGLHMPADVSDVDLEQIVQLRTLKVVQFSDYAIEPERLRQLASLHEIEQVEVMGATPPAVVSVIATIPGVKYFFWHTEGRLVARDLSRLSEARSLLKLYLYGLKDADVLLGELLAAAPSIEALHLYECDVTSVGLNKLSELPNLILVGLNDRQLTAETIAQLSTFPKLRNLSVMYTSEPYAVPWKECIRFRELTWVQFERIPTREHLHGELRSLTAVPGLRHLALNAISVDNADVDALADLTQLAELTIYGAEPQLTSAGLERLRAALPGCAIDARVAEALPAP